ncbi:MAG: hypothetical protein WC208_16515 [Gallionella sp.]|jgi:hypothetical protein
MKWVYNDGGRADAGYKGKTGDCVCRAIAIVTEQPYQTVYDTLNEVKGSLRQTKRIRKSHSRKGVNRRIYERYLKTLGWVWTPTMHIGQGCKVHLRPEELPSGRIIARVSHHLVAVIDGVAHDNHDPTREGDRCVYGYYSKEGAEQ